MRPKAPRSDERRIAADGWHIGRHDAHYLTRDGVAVAVVYWRSEGWTWWDFLSGSGTVAESFEAAKAAAEGTKCATKANSATAGTGGIRGSVS